MPKVNCSATLVGAHRSSYHKCIPNLQKLRTNSSSRYTGANKSHAVTSGSSAEMAITCMTLWWLSASFTTEMENIVETRRCRSDGLHTHSVTFIDQYQSLLTYISSQLTFALYLDTSKRTKNSHEQHHCNGIGTPRLSQSAYEE